MACVRVTTPPFLCIVTVTVDTRDPQRALQRLALRLPTSPTQELALAAMCTHTPFTAEQVHPRRSTAWRPSPRTVTMTAIIMHSLTVAIMVARHIRRVLVLWCHHMQSIPSPVTVAPHSPLRHRRMPLVLTVTLPAAWHRMSLRVPAVCSRYQCLHTL